MPGYGVERIVVDSWIAVAGMAELGEPLWEGKALRLDWPVSDGHASTHAGCFLLPTANLRSVSPAPLVSASFEATALTRATAGAQPVSAPTEAATLTLFEPQGEALLPKGLSWYASRPGGDLLAHPISPHLPPGLLNLKDR